jgi:hypothetical protein
MENAVAHLNQVHFEGAQRLRMQRALEQFRAAARTHKSRDAVTRAELQDAKLRQLIQITRTCFLNFDVAFAHIVAS